MNIRDIIIRMSDIPTKEQVQNWEEKLSHIGNLENLTTENKNTLVDAINEVQETAGSASNAEEVSYDDSNTQLGAVNAQEAIIALYNKYKAIEVLANNLEQEVSGNVSALSGINTEVESTVGIEINDSEEKEEIASKLLLTVNKDDELRAKTTNAIDISYSDETTNLGATNLQEVIEILANKFTELENRVNNTNNIVSTKTAELSAINIEVENEIGSTTNQL